VGRPVGFFQVWFAVDPLFAAKEYRKAGNNQLVSGRQEPMRPGLERRNAFCA